MRRSASLSARSFRYSIKYPLVVSYNKLPWNVVKADSADVHQYVVPQYHKLFRVASNTTIPLLVANQHPKIPNERVLHLLPGMMYFLPGANQPLNEDMGWTAVSEKLSPVAHQFYAQLLTDFCYVSNVNVFKSGDLRLLCNTFTVSNWKVPIASYSSISALGANGEGTFFHYFRPNRPHSELLAPFSRIAAKFPRSDTINSFSEAVNWTPKFAAKRPANARATPMPKFVPPTSYLSPPPERLAVTPGDAIGRRSLMWGHWF